MYLFFSDRDVTLPEYINAHDKCLSSTLCVHTHVCVCMRACAKINYEHVVQIGMKAYMTCSVIRLLCQTSVFGSHAAAVSDVDGS